MQLHLDMRERLQARAEFAAGASNTFGHRADQPVIAGQQGDDPVASPSLCWRSTTARSRYSRITIVLHPATTSRVSAPIVSYPVVGASGSDAGAISGSGNQRLPTLTDLLYQLATRAVTSEDWCDVPCARSM